jgi:gliding motility-associated lipoprotein GldH
LLATSCNHVYKEYDKESFPTYTWGEQKIKFSPTIEDFSKSYRLILGIRHLYGFQLGSIEVTIKTISPSGKEVVKHYELKIKDSANRYLAKCSGDYCDLETVIEDHLSFTEGGQYTYVITHNGNAEIIPGVMELGLIIDERK